MLSPFNAYNAFLPWIWAVPTLTVPSGLVGYWPLNNNTGTSATETINGDNGTLHGDEAWTTGQISYGTVGSLAGAGYISAPQNGHYSLSAHAFTVSMWVNSANFSNLNRIVSWYDGTSSIVILAATGVGGSGTRNVYGFYIGTIPGASKADTYDAGAAATGTWTHIVADWNGSSVAHMYMNATVSTSSVLSNIAVFTGNSTTMYFGQRGDNARYYDGAIDDIRIYDRVLSSTEVTQIYNAGVLHNP